MLEKILDILRRIIPKPVFEFFQSPYHFLLAVTGNILYRFPGYKMTVIGVTGTNGKTTAVELICESLKASGKKVGMISTVHMEVLGKRWENKTSRTTLGRWKTQKLLRKMVKAGCDYAVIEVASEGIAWYRTFGIPFDGAVFTNLTPEHLNMHKTMENYRNTKGKLFAKLSSPFNFKKTKRVSVVNADDKYAKYFLSFKADKKITYGIEGGDLKAKNIKSRVCGIDFVIMDGKKEYQVKSKALGVFNVYNMLAAFATSKTFGGNEKEIIRTFEEFRGTIGRVERIEGGQDFTVIVDYAVTPDAQKAVYEEMRKFTKGRLAAVFGATGDRDKKKRPKMGKTAASLCDIVYLTDDETYHEDSRKIIEEVYDGVGADKKEKVTIIPDRYQAIKRAIKEAKKGDTIIITGIGHQKYRNIGGKKMAWDERKIVGEILGGVQKGKNG